MNNSEGVKTKEPARISVALCSYNGERYLAEQLQSISNQTLLPFEVVICDDGSTDQTIEIVRSFKAAVSFRVRIVENTVNLGSTKNFEQAIRLAEGDYIALSDQDDIWLPKKLELLAECLQANAGLAGVFSDAWLFPAISSAPEATLWQTHGFTHDEQERFAGGGALPLLLKGDLVTGATLMLRADARELWYPIPSSWVHDGWIAWLIVLRAELALYAEPLMMYRVHENQQIGLGPSRQAKFDQIRRLERKRYQQRAEQITHLLERLADGGENDLRGAIGHLRTKRSFLEMRARYSKNRIWRFLAIVAKTQHYRLYARGWRSMRKDLIFD